MSISYKHNKILNPKSSILIRQIGLYKSGTVTIDGVVRYISLQNDANFSGLDFVYIDNDLPASTIKNYNFGLSFISAENTKVEIKDYTMNGNNYYTDYEGNVRNCNFFTSAYCSHAAAGTYGGGAYSAPCIDKNKRIQLSIIKTNDQNTKIINYEDLQNLETYPWIK